MFAQKEEDSDSEAESEDLEVQLRCIVGTTCEDEAERILLQLDNPQSQVLFFLLWSNAGV